MERSEVKLLVCKYPIVSIFIISETNINEKTIYKNIEGVK